GLRPRAHAHRRRPSEHGRPPGRTGREPRGPITAGTGDNGVRSAARQGGRAGDVTAQPAHYAWTQPDSSLVTPMEAFSCTNFQSPSSRRKTALHRGDSELPSGRVRVKRVTAQPTVPSLNAWRSESVRTPP